MNLKMLPDNFLISSSLNLKSMQATAMVAVSVENTALSIGNKAGNAKIKAIIKLASMLILIELRIRFDLVIGLLSFSI